MAKGIREFALTRFNQLLPKVGALGPTGFRRKIMDEIKEQFGVSVASAATAYNYALGVKRKEDPRSVSGIGRDPAAAKAAQGGGGTNKAAAPAPAPAAPAAQPAGKAEGTTSAPAVTVRDPVMVVRARDGEVVAKDINRMFAQSLIAASSGRGRPKLVIKEDQAETA